MERLESERLSKAAPMSFTGSAERIWRPIVWDRSPAVKWLLAVPAALLLVTLAWLVVAGWYVLFGLLLVPFRLVRRGSRKRKRDEQRHREMLDAQQQGAE